jgi:hypothetical protein
MMRKYFIKRSPQRTYYVDLYLLVATLQEEKTLVFLKIINFYYQHKPQYLGQYNCVGGESFLAQICKVSSICLQSISPESRHGSAVVPACGGGVWVEPSAAQTEKIMTSGLVFIVHDTSSSARSISY